MGLTTTALNRAQQAAVEYGAGAAAAKYPVDGKFKTTATIDALNAGTEIDVPVMIGSNGGEGGFDGARKIASLAGDTGAGAWLYNFVYVPDFRKNEWKNGAIHSAEIMFAFDSAPTSSWSTGPGGTVNDTSFRIGRRGS